MPETEPAWQKYKDEIWDARNQRGEPRTGLRFRGGKGSFYEGGLRIPFIVRWPEKIEPGSVSDHLGYFPDIMPTLAELAGIDLRVETDGISIVPTLLGEEVAGRSQREHSYLYWEDGRSTAIRAGNWKAIRPAESDVFELYDIEHDPEEKHDVASEHAGDLKKLLDLAAQSHRPPLQGKVLDPSAGFKGHQN